MNNQEIELIIDTLQKMLENKNNRQFTQYGLCYWADRIYYNLSSISYQALALTCRYIQENRPSFGFDYILYGTDGSYYWKKGVTAPRVRWLNKHIKLLTKLIKNGQKDRS